MNASPGLVVDACVAAKWHLRDEEIVAEEEPHLDYDCIRWIPSPNMSSPWEEILTEVYEAIPIGIRTSVVYDIASDHRTGVPVIFDPVPVSIGTSFKFPQTLNIGA